MDGAKVPVPTSIGGTGHGASSWNRGAITGAIGGSHNQIIVHFGNFTTSEDRTSQLDEFLRRLENFIERKDVQSQLTNYSDDDKEVWRLFRRDLRADGFRSEHIAKHSTELKAHLVHLSAGPSRSNDGIAIRSEQSAVTKPPRATVQTASPGLLPDGGIELPSISHPKTVRFAATATVFEGSFESEGERAYNTKDEEDISSSSSDTVSTTNATYHSHVRRRSGSSYDHLTLPVVSQDFTEPSPRRAIDASPSRRRDRLPRSNKVYKTVSSNGQYHARHTQHFYRSHQTPPPYRSKYPHTQPRDIHDDKPTHICRPLCSFHLEDEHTWDVRRFVSPAFWNMNFPHVSQKDRFWLTRCMLDQPMHRWIPIVNMYFRYVSQLKEGHKQNPTLGQPSPSTILSWTVYNVQKAEKTKRPNSTEVRIRLYGKESENPDISTEDVTSSQHTTTAVGDDFEQGPIPLNAESEQHEDQVEDPASASTWTATHPAAESEAVKEAVDVRFPPAKISSAVQPESVIKISEQSDSLPEISSLSNNVDEPAATGETLKAKSKEHHNEDEIGNEEGIKAELTNIVEPLENDTSSKEHKTLKEGNTHGTAQAPNYQKPYVEDADEEPDGEGDLSIERPHPL